MDANGVKMYCPQCGKKKINNYCEKCDIDLSIYNQPWFGKNGYDYRNGNVFVDVATIYIECPKCGFTVLQKDTYCPQCGNQVKNKKQAPCRQTRTNFLSKIIKWLFK